MSPVAASKNPKAGTVADRIPWHVLLVTLFFASHGWAEHYYDLGFTDLLPVIGIYLLAGLLLTGLGRWLFRSWIRAGLFATFLLSIHLFFGSYKDFLSASALLHPIGRYGILLSLLFLLTIGVIVFLKKTPRRLIRLNGYLNFLFLLLILIDAFTIVRRPSKRPAAFSVKADELRVTPCDTCHYPDIYLLLCDEFASSRSLDETWHYNNYQFDTALNRRGFRVAAGSHSNYNFTPFSMASILNMAYVEGIGKPSAISQEDYSRCNTLIYDNRLMHVLSDAGYQVVNYSIFDLDGNPSAVNQSYLPLKTRLFTGQTLLNRLWKDFAYLLLEGKFRVNWIAEPRVYEPLHNNERFIAATKTIAATPHEHPRFVYTHLLMPHLPWYYDSAGKRRDPSLYATDYLHLTPEVYLESVTYTSRRMLGLIDTILQQSVTPPVIVLMGDHGFRRDAPGGTVDLYRNMNAVYMPGSGDHGLYDSISAVNEFRVVLNGALGQKIPLLKDSTILLTDKK